MVRAVLRHHTEVKTATPPKKPCRTSSFRIEAPPPLALLRRTSYSCKAPLVVIGGDPSGKGGSGFRTTCWTDVLEVNAPDPADAEIALARLYQDYWWPLYAFARRGGRSPQECEDLIQDFFVALVEKRRLGGLEREGGRFRSFLIKSLQNFMWNQHDRSHAIKRGGGVPMVQLDDAEVHYRPDAGSPAPEEQFDRDWAEQIVRIAKTLVQEEYTRAGKQQLFASLSPLLIRNVQTADYAALSVAHGMTVGALKVAIHRCRVRFAESVRAEIRRTVEVQGDVQDELRHLLKVIGSEQGIAAGPVGP
jgi:DNA-directed RNA polymerase specialized sigma24 family protein